MAQQQEDQPLHDGQTLKRHVAKSPLIPARIAERMGVAHSTLLGYYDSPSLRTHVLRRASRALGYNFFFDLGMQLPENLPSALDTALRRRVAELEKENERLRIEIGVYEKIMKK